MLDFRLHHAPSMQFQPTHPSKTEAVSTHAEGLNCQGQCLQDEDADGVCDVFEVLGCTDVAAMNFDVEATENNGTCEYSTGGCTDMRACNFSHEATENDGTCDYDCLGCMSIFACNYDPAATLHNPLDCEFLVSLDIAGPALVSGGEEVVYFIEGSADAAPTWDVQGGALISGQHSSQITVVWTEPVGRVEVMETTQNGCQGELFFLEVNADVTLIDDVLDAFVVYPNPASATLNVEIPFLETTALTILDATGRVVYSRSQVNQRLTISTAELSDGMYHVVLSSGGAKAGATADNCTMTKGRRMQTDLSDPVKGLGAQANSLILNPSILDNMRILLSLILVFLVVWD